MAYHPAMIGRKSVIASVNLIFVLFILSLSATPACSKKKEGGVSQPVEKQEKKKPQGRLFGAKADGVDIPEGRWGKTRALGDDGHVAPWQAKQVAQLEALGYVSGSQAATDKGGVTRALSGFYDGYNLYTSGHAPLAILMDMAGNPIHTWRFDFEKAWPKYPGRFDQVPSKFWRRVHLFENGDLLAIFDGLGMIKIDRHSRLIWKSANREHHDLEVMPNGDIFVLTRKRHKVSWLNEKKPVVEDFVTLLDKDGKKKREISVLEALKHSKYAELWNRKRSNRGDVFHTNTLHVLRKSHENAPEFKKGRILTSMMRLNIIALIDFETAEVVWAFRDDFKAQHDPQILEPTGNLILFDNKGGNSKQGRSRILVYQLPEMKQVWQFEGDKGDKFFTLTCGAVQRLPNGNTLITETDNGRAFEVTPKKKIVWEYYNPHRAGPDNELVASLFELKRYAKSYVRWLEVNNK